MIKYLLFLTTTIFLTYNSNAQCNIAIPSNVAIADGVTSPPVGASKIWICDTIAQSGIDEIYYLESGAKLTGSGIRAKAYVKSGAEYGLNGGSNDTVYYEAGAILSNAPSHAILCPSIIFDYTNAPTSLCNLTTKNEDLINVKPSLKIFPNPANSYIGVVSNYIISEMQMLDISGKVVKFIYTGFDSIDVSELKKGIYFLKINTEKGHLVEKVILE